MLCGVDYSVGRRLHSPVFSSGKDRSINQSVDRSIDWLSGCELKFSGGQCAGLNGLVIACLTAVWSTHTMGSLFITTTTKNVKAAHTRLPSVGFRSWSRFLAVSLQVMWVINPAVGCHYFPPSLQLPSQPLRGLLPVLLLGEQRNNGFEQFS